MEECEFRKKYSRQLNEIQSSVDAKLVAYFKARNFRSPRLTARMVYEIFRMIKEKPELLK